LFDPILLFFKENPVKWVNMPFLNLPLIGSSPLSQNYHVGSIYLTIM